MQPCKFLLSEIVMGYISLLEYSAKQVNKRSKEELQCSKIVLELCIIPKFGIAVFDTQEPGQGGQKCYARGNARSGWNCALI
jgi:hypothetical protein